MFVVCRYARKPYTPLLQRHGYSQLRRAINRTVSKDELRPSGPVAERLADTDVWIPRASYLTKADKEAQEVQTRRRSKKPEGKGSKATGDKTRVNITSEKLCDDIISYIGRSLNRHKGCDLIDISPGCGLWSQKLHDHLKPRSHILLEPDAELYRPFLQPLLDRPGTTLVPKSGIIWRDLKTVLQPEYLPHQSRLSSTDPRITQRNDTLLVTANLAFHPKRRYGQFDSVSVLLLHQFIRSIQTSTLFQGYGLVRLLIWARHDDHRALIPKALQCRKRLSVDVDLSCDWVNQVCGAEGLEQPWFMREQTIVEASDMATYKRMRDAGIKMPRGREPENYLAAKRWSRASRKMPVPGQVPPTFKRPYKVALDAFQAAHDEEMADQSSDTLKLMKRYEWRATSEYKKSLTYLEQLQSLDHIKNLRKSGDAPVEEVRRLESEWNDKLLESPKGMASEFGTYRDNIFVYRQDPPGLAWDRRPYEPLVVKEDEFFPNLECSLLDIQPKAMHPLLRQVGPGTSRAGDMLEQIMSSMMAQGIQPLGPTLDAIWPGSGDYIGPRWESIRDEAPDGIYAHSRYSGITARLLNARQWEELLELWMEWPLHPEYHELISRTMNEQSDAYDDDYSAAGMAD
ncbi:S-adenosyl-L-methionine-dependent methyltransferase [Xylariomycetidae sp. FL2044]|nr:S-adenosyl-L-methionine-dependent methyltransferase [Xylariomycetidae sp. FL2044]